MKLAAALVAALALASCKNSEKKQVAPAPAGSAAPAAPAGSGSAAGSAAESAPAEAAAVVGPTKSATGTLAVSGAMTGTFEWKKKDQRSPISCAWNAEKEIGGLHIDVSDGAGQLVTLGIDVPPAELGPGRLDVSSKTLPATLKTFTAFKVSGDDEGHIKVVFDDTKVVTDPDAQLKASANRKQADKPSGPELTIKGTLEVTCPKK
jgi:hypothetical protein